MRTKRIVIIGSGFRGMKDGRKGFEGHFGEKYQIDTL